MAVRLHRTFDADALNRVANDNAVRPALGGEGVIDLTSVVERSMNFALADEGGGFVLTALAPGHYEVHSLFLPGSDAIGAMREACEWMFTRTDCVAIFSKVPKANRAAKGLALAGGLRTAFERNHEAFGPTEFVELPLMRWVMSCAVLEAHGERFHAALDAAKAAKGSSLPAHAHDPAHERAVGAALLMIERGQAGKGVAFYNLWAGVAGYQAISLLSLSPVTIDTGDAVLGLGSEGMEVLLCR